MSSHARQRAAQAGFVRRHDGLRVQAYIATRRLACARCGVLICRGDTMTRAACGRGTVSAYVCVRCLPIAYGHEYVPRYDLRDDERREAERKAEAPHRADCGCVVPIITHVAAALRPRDWLDAYARAVAGELGLRVAPLDDA